MKNNHLGGNKLLKYVVHRERYKNSKDKTNRVSRKFNKKQIFWSVLGYLIVLVVYNLIFNF